MSIEHLYHNPKLVKALPAAWKAAVWRLVSALLDRAAPVCQAPKKLIFRRVCTFESMCNITLAFWSLSCELNFRYPHVHSDGFKPARTQRKAHVTAHVWPCLCNGNASPFGAKICGNVCDTYMSIEHLYHNLELVKALPTAWKAAVWRLVSALLYSAAPVCQAPKKMIFRRARVQTGPVDTTSCPETEFIFRPKRHRAVGATIRRV
jgi:hypothetical protein